MKNQDLIKVMVICLVIIVALIFTLVQQRNLYEDTIKVERDNAVKIYKYLVSCQAVSGATVEQIDAAYNYLFIQEVEFQGSNLQQEVFPESEGTSETLNQLGIQNE